MDAKELEHRIEALEKRQSETELFMNKSIRNIQVGITEIKTMLEEREKQSDYKDTSTKEEIKEINEKLDKIMSDVPKISDHEKRISKIEDNQQWLWRTVGGAVITTIIGLIITAIKAFK